MAEGETGDVAEKKPVDLRFSKVEQSGVRIDRDLSGQGHLARGSFTNMSNMRFSVRAQSRTELDPELQALRGVEVVQAVVPVAPVLPVVGVPVVEPTSGAAVNNGVFAAIKRLFS